MKKIGILSLQGDVSEHVFSMERAMRDLIPDGEVTWVRTRDQLKGLSGLIIPGGESTTQGMLISKYKMDDDIRKLAERKVPIMGTCAGLVLLAKKGNKGVNLLGLMNMRVKRNAFGRQRESFEVDLNIPSLSDGKRAFHAVFIRAPAIESVWGDVEIMAEYENRIVMARQDNLLAVAFHPELGDDLRIHEYFLRLIER